MVIDASCPNCRRKILFQEDQLPSEMLCCGITFRKTAPDDVIGRRAVHDKAGKECSRRRENSVRCGNVAAIEMFYFGVFRIPFGGVRAFLCVGCAAETAPTSKR